MSLYERKDAHGSWLGCGSFEWTPQWVEGYYDRLVGSELELFERVCKQLPCAKEYLVAHADEFGWDEEMIARASIFTPSELPRPVPYYPKYWHCYENSFAYAEKTGCKYIEGLAVGPAGALIHAWCSTNGKDLIDYTWPYQHVNKYFGMELKISKMRDNGYPFGAVLGHLWADTKKKLQKQTEAA